MTAILPENFDDKIKNAVKSFWHLRLNSNSNSQEGARGAVISGGNLDGFTHLIKDVVIHCGLPESSVIISGKKRLTIPGYFRPTKIWDALVIYKSRLIAAFELKSQVGSFGNNFNNRTEESIGSAKDFWTAHRESAFSLDNYSNQKSISNLVNKDITPPFLAYLMLLESCDASNSPVRVEEEHFRVFSEFNNSSYATRYKILCERLILENMYSATSLVLSNRTNGLASGDYSSPSTALSPKSLFAELAGKLLAAKEVYG